MIDPPILKVAEDHVFNEDQWKWQKQIWNHWKSIENIKTNEWNHWQSMKINGKCKKNQHGSLKINDNQWKHKKKSTRIIKNQGWSQQLPIQHDPLRHPRGTQGSRQDRDRIATPHLEAPRIATGSRQDRDIGFGPDHTGSHRITQDQRFWRFFTILRVFLWGS